MRLKDMANDEKEEGEGIPLPPSSSGKYPYGLCLCLTEKDLKKLDLDDEVEAGDFLHGVFMAKVTSVSKRDHEETGKGTRVELQIVAMGIEDEATEYGGDDDEE